MALTARSIALSRPLTRPQQKKHRLDVGRIAVYLALIGLSILFCIPFLWLVATSLKPPDEVFSNGWIGSDIHTKNYTDVFRYAPVWTWLRNSLFVAALSVITVVFSSALIAYGFARLRFRGRNQLFAFVIATYMVPSAATMVPTFLIWNHFHLVGTFYPLWATNIFGSAFYIFLLRQFLMGIPQDLVDAARVDGASYLRIFWSITLPLIRPALIAVAIFEFQAKWNDFMTPLIYLNKPSMYTMSLGLGLFKSDYETQWALWMAASVIFTLPMVALFFVAQRFFIQGVSRTGLKG
ncbi:MAG: carbohydrate ABC transporter permease [Thermomicrobiales bacterium]